MLLSRTAQRRLAVLFLLDTLSSIFYPAASLALTAGTHQPEYTSYEPATTTDMVNLATGDFTYNLPVLEVPGPEGGFSIPLSYHSGIGLEDEASWVGLGWNINVGAINRSKVGTADDALDEITDIRVTDPGGSGYVKSYGPYQKSWDSNKGYGGALNMMNITQYSWSGKGIPKPRNMESVTVLGLSASKGNVSFNPTKFAQGVMAIGTMVASAGIGSAATAGASAGTITTGQAATIKLASMGVSSAISAAQGLSARSAGGTTYGQIGEFITSRTPGKRRMDYKYWLDANREEHGYGALYLGQMQKSSVVPPSLARPDAPYIPRLGTTSSYTNATLFKNSAYLASGHQAVTSDMHMYVEPNTEYAYVFNPTSIAYDAYSVMGPGISGSMTPYRPEVGSLVYPKKMSENTRKFNLFPFLDEGTAIDKVQFRFEGELSNTYRHHDSGGPGLTQSYSSANNAKRLYYRVQDIKLTNASQRAEANRDGLYNKKLAEARHVEWFTYGEMKSGIPQTQGRIMGYPVEAGWGHSGIDHKIGAYAITASDGVTYHYSLPVFNTAEVFFRGVTGQETTKQGTSVNEKAYATSWLLTAITGPDFVDQGVKGIVDQQDAGYWVRFDYGRFTTDYNWRLPYVGYIKEDGFSSYSKGRREVYYLNSIKTRTHTALFFKDIRRDGRASYRRASDGRTLPGTEPAGNGPLDTDHPASSLLLREIALLNNADYDQLVSQGFSATSALGTQKAANELSAPQSSSSYVKCSLDKLFDVYDIAQNPAFRAFLNQKAERRIVLNTSYDLCPGTLNSFENATSPPFLDGAYLNSARLGKLTLNSVTCYGPNSVRLFPDFKFQYNSPNPRYSQDLWDGWGSYNTAGATSHTAAGSDPTAWHLTDITTPMGGRVSVKYESDDYSSISGEPIKQRIPISGFSTNGLGNSQGRITFNTSNIAPYRLDQLLANGTQIVIKDLVAKQLGNCWEPFAGSFSREREYLISANQQVQSVTSSGFVINRPTVYGGHGNTVQGCGQCSWSSISGYIEVTMPKKKGGNVRVAVLTAKGEPNQEYKTEYRYTTDGTAQGSSSGVVAQEPSYISTVDYPFYHLFDFPNTGVLYNKVSVLDGIIADGTYAGRTEYTFTTPRTDMVQVVTPITESLNLPNDFREDNSHLKNAKRWYYDVASRISQVGRIEKINIFDGNGLKIGATEFEYTEVLPRSQGIYTSGSTLAEIEREGSCIGQTTCPPMYFKFSRTNKTYYPNVLKSIYTTNNGVSTIQRNVAWDFYTGDVQETISQDPLGARYKTVTVPAYTKYSGLRPKAQNSSNKHMLTQNAQTTISKLDDAGSPSGVVSSSAQTWSNSWTRRAENSAGVFANVAALAPVWRVKSAYVWHPQIVEANGTTSIGKFAAYDWAAGAIQSPSWEKTAETTSFDEYSANLELRNGTGTNDGTVKYGYNQSQVLLRATNARYSEVAYSGAEDGDPNSNFFGGEVAGATFTSSDVSHTGSKCIKLNSNGQKGFVFNTPINATTGAEPGRAYRASVWVYLPSAANGRLYASTVNGSRTAMLATAVGNATVVRRAGDWALLEVVFTIPSSLTSGRVIVGCENVGSGPVYFDDFRFSPLDAASTAYIYDTQSWSVTHQLNNDNFFTRYEYDNRGRIAKTYVEILSDAAPHKLVAEQVHNYARDSRYTITTRVSSINGSISPQGNTDVYQGDDIKATVSGNSCSWQASGYFTILGTRYLGSANMPDGTRVRLNYATGEFIIENINNNYTVEVELVDRGYSAAGTDIIRTCEIDNSNNCRTGRVFRTMADGCGGRTAPEEVIPGPEDNCFPEPGCVALRAQVKEPVTQLINKGSKVKKATDMLFKSNRK